MVKVITTQDGFLSFFPDGDPNTKGRFNLTEMDKEVGAYWDSVTEKRFVLPLWRAKALFSKSNIQQLTLRITDFSKSTEVDGEWLSLDADLGQSLEKRNNEVNAEDSNIHYFVFGKSLVDHLELAYDEMLDDKRPPEEERMIVARLGKQTITNNGNQEIQFVVFFILGETKIHQGGDGGNFMSHSCGSRIPPK